MLISQNVNFSNAGTANDPLMAEAHDFSGLNNANMMTPADGQSPVMQLYLWHSGRSKMEVISPCNGCWK